MYHVLLALDSNVERSLAAARAVADLPGTDEITVTILNVQAEIEVSSGDGSHVSSEDWWDPEAFPESVERAKELLEGEGLAVEARREHADPAAAILAVSDEEGVDAIVMAGRKQSPVGKVLFGSVTQSVLLSADVPVTVVGGS